MVVSNSLNAPEEIKAAKFPKIRMFTVQKNPKATPQTDCTGKWEVCAPETAGHFSAVGYFFARHLEKNLQFPIGVIHTSWGGTPAEHWTPTDVIAADPDFQGRIKGWEAVKANYPKAKAAFDETLAKWKTAAEQAKAENKPAPPQPRPPAGGDDFGGPGCLYNGMIAPVLPYTIRGVIWYQGESNASNAAQYAKLFPLMIQSWRQRWNVGEFPFLFVQLANFRGRFEEPVDSQWAALREAQLRTLELPHTGMAVAIDIGDAKDIHPKNKQEVGRRLALNALATVYYKEIDYSGPLPSGVQQEDGKMRITFRYAEGLKTTDGGKPKGFAIAGADKKIYWAEAEIQGDHVILQSAKVADPVAVRYGWQDNPEVNLINGSGLPASPFRSDDWAQTPPPPK
jgi:sialate O-acetylesterase